MKKISTMMDSKLGKSYDLYTVHARELVQLIQGVYEKQGITPLFVQRFNSDFTIGTSNRSYAEQLTNVWRIETGYEQDYRQELAQEKQQLKETEERFLQGTAFKEKNNTLSAMGYELMPFAVSVKNQDLENERASLELLDGFRRIFFTSTIPDQEVLLKVYDTLDDREWVSSMIVFNSWKFVHNNPLMFLDRGFKLGLYKRYNIDFTALIYCGRHDYRQTIERYIARTPYYTLWQNELFSSDILFMQEVKKYRPVFTIKKKAGEQIFDAATNPYTLPYFLEKIHNVLANELGSFRRKETQALLQAETVLRKPMDFADYLEFMQDKTLQKHFIKLSEMSVNGFIDNYIEKHLLNRIRLIVHPSLVPEEKKEATQLTIQLDELKV